ncbi:Acyl-CoA N-acyltransferase [Penicillium canariense]|uniref:Acyl-CoA N-acyltransferase n=1 Tax=Penicillium canariense TaxID=189055 RepID=A0A9W9LIR0_9EURO|nr:Acyl-CoA N-acyltransferase [Penicillium canariense]KAJ5157739.1 Acyl-CoA N-acyltransferase [Penicillium canariense]
MTFEVHIAEQADAPKLTEVFCAAFSDPFNRTMFPDTPGVRTWLEHNLFSGMDAPADQVMLKVADSSVPGTVVAFAKWRRLSSGSSADHDRQPEVPAARWPEESDAELCDRFFGTMDGHHREFMEGRPHYYLEILAVHSSYQGRGLASKLLRWGLARADEEAVEVYLSSSPDGRPLYQKYGFQAVGGSFSPFPGYEQVNMIRPVRKEQA